LRQRCNNRAVYQSQTADSRRLASEHALYVAATMQHALNNHVGTSNAVKMT
jgi:hypothetical protein